MLFDITRVNRNLPLLLCTFGRSFQRTGDVTRNDSQQRFLAQYRVQMLEQYCSHSKQYNNNVAKLCCANGSLLRIVPCNITLRYKTSTWNEIKELIKSNCVIVPSLLNRSPKNMTWNDRWETKLFLGGKAELHAGTEVKWTTLIQFSLLDAIKRFTRLWTESCFYFLSPSCVYSAVRPVFPRNV